MQKRIFREDEKREQEETQDYQRSIPSILDPMHSEQPSDVTKIQIPGFTDISVALTAPHRHTSSLDILSSSVFQDVNIVYLLFIVSQMCFSKNDFLLFSKTRFLYSLSC